MDEKDFYQWAGQKMRELRKQAGLTQEELAIKTGIARPLISKFENTGKKISAFRIKQMLEAMGYSLSDLDEKKNRSISLSMLPA